jgi:hypothetical protein
MTRNSYFVEDFAVLAGLGNFDKAVGRGEWNFL